jgi:hypothetical protein
VCCLHSWEEAASKCEGPVKFRAVFYKGGKYKGGKFFEDYEGDRSSLALIDFAKSHLEAASKQWSQEQLMTGDFFPWAMLYTM